VNSIVTKIVLAVVMLCVFTTAGIAEEFTMINVLENIPYQDEGLGKRKLIDEDHLLVMQMALKPGQQVPQHNANSNVHLLILKGSSVTVTLDGSDTVAKEGDVVPVAHQTPMIIKNTGSDDATFMVIKTPNPSKM